MRYGTTIAAAAALAALASSAPAQEPPAHALLEEAAEAMGGLERLRALDNVVLTLAVNPSDRASTARGIRPASPRRAGNP